ALHGQDVGSAFDTVVRIAPATRMLVPQFLAGGRDPEFGWPAIAQMLAEARADNAAKMDEFARASAAFMTMASDDPSLRAGRNALIPGLRGADGGPQGDYAALAAGAEAVARRPPRFAGRFWDATRVAHGTAGVGDCVGWPFAARNPPHRLNVGSHANVMVAN